jgi:hypothetical protein
MPRRKPTGPRDRRSAARVSAGSTRGPDAASHAAYLARQRVICEQKDRYASEAEARAFAVMHQPGPGARAHTYHCEVCGGWHHTRGR